MFWDKKFKEFEYKVGFVLFWFILFLVFFLIYIGIKKDIFAKRVNYYIISKSGENIERGIPVKLSGFKIGQVEKLYLDKVDYIKIKISILEKYRKWFRKDTRIILDQEGIIGNPYLKVIPGSDKSPILPSGYTLTLTKVGGINELLMEAQPVIEDMKKIVANLRKITDDFLDKKSSIQRTIVNFEKITDNILKNKGFLYYLTQDNRPVKKFDSLLSHSDELVITMNTFLKNATLAIEDVRPIEKEFFKISKEVKSFVKDLKTIRKELQPIIDNTKDITLELKKATKDIYRLKIEAEYTLKKSNDILSGLQDKWPFKTNKEIIKNIEIPKP